jgi:MFS family permease
LDRRLLVLGYCLFLGPFGGVNIIIPMQAVLQKDLATSLEMVTLSISMAMVPFALLQFFTGALADAWEPRRTLLAGLAVYGIGSFLCAVTPDIWTFLAGRAVQGIGLAFFNPVALAMVGGLVPGERRGYVMGWMGTINTAGIATGPLAGGLAAMHDWRSAYYLIIAMTAVAVGLFAWTFSAASIPRATKGRILQMLGEVAVVRPLQLVCIGGFAAFFAYGAMLTFTGEALEGPPFDLSEGAIGSAIALGGLSGILVSPGAGRFADRIGRGKAAMLGFAIAFAGYVGFAFASSTIVMFAMFFLMGVAMSFTWAGLVTLSVELVPGARNTSSTLFNATRFSGYALSPFLMVFLYTSKGLPAVMAVSACAALVGLAAAALVSRRPGGDTPDHAGISGRPAGPK